MQGILIDEVFLLTVALDPLITAFGVAELGAWLLLRPPLRANVLDIAVSERRLLRSGPLRALAGRRPT